MIIRWAQGRRTGLWHAFVFFPGHRTKGSACSAFLKNTPKTLLYDKPMTPGTEKICKNCIPIVMGMKKRYVVEDGS